MTKDFDDGTLELIGALIWVHKQLGPGLLESAYEACVCIELMERGLPFERQRPVKIEYCGRTIDVGYRLDLVVYGSIVVELKAVSSLLPIHTAQLMTYLKLAKLRVGLLVNFNAVSLRDGGLRRIELRD